MEKTLQDRLIYSWLIQLIYWLAAVPIRFRFWRYRRYIAKLDRQTARLTKPTLGVWLARNFPAVFNRDGDLF